MAVHTTPYQTQVSLPADLRRFQAGCISWLAMSMAVPVLLNSGDMSGIAVLLLMGIGMTIMAPLMLVIGSGLVQWVSRSRWGQPALLAVALGWSALGSSPGGLNTGTKLLACLLVALIFYAGLAWSIGHVYRLQLDGRALTMARGRTQRALSAKTEGWLRRRERVIPLESISSADVRRFPWWPVRRFQVVLGVEGEGTVPIWSGPLSQKEAEKLAAKVRRQIEGQRDILQRAGHDLSERPQVPAALQSIRGEKPPSMD